MYFITIKRMLEVCFSAHPNIQYRAGIAEKDNRQVKKIVKIDMDVCDEKENVIKI